jgi:hypothetical protein
MHLDKGQAPGSGGEDKGYFGGISVLFCVDQWPLSFPFQALRFVRSGFEVFAVWLATIFHPMAIWATD